MPPRGPAPEPSAVKKFKGNPGKRELNRYEPKPPTGVPDKPAHLTDAESEIWDSIVYQMLRVPGLLTLVDGQTLAKLVSLESDWIDNEVELKKTGLLYKDPTGRVTKSPRLVIKQELAAQCLVLYRELGLTPSARSRINVSPSREADDPVGSLMCN